MFIFVIFASALLSDSNSIREMRHRRQKDDALLILWLGGLSVLGKVFRGVRLLNAELGFDVLMLVKGGATKGLAVRAQSG